MTLTARQTEVLAAYVEHENYLDVSLALDIGFQTTRNHMHSAYKRLGTNNILGALKAMGWLEVGE